MSNRSPASAKRSRRGAIQAADGGRCHYCWRELALEQGTEDHIVPLARGGSNYFGNLVWSCKPCNLVKGDGDGSCVCERCQLARWTVLGYTHPRVGDSSRARGEAKAAARAEVRAAEKRDRRLRLAGQRMQQRIGGSDLEALRELHDRLNLP